MQKNIIKVNGDGWLTKNPEFKYIKELDKNICILEIAVNHTKRNKEEPREDDKTSFFEIEVWGDLAIICNKHLNAGSKITFYGNLKQDRWISNTGIKKSKIKIIAEEIRFDHISQKD